MSKEKLTFTPFKVFEISKNPDIAEMNKQMIQLAEEHHKERPSYTVEEYLGAFNELLGVRRRIIKNETGY